MTFISTFMGELIKDEDLGGIIDWRRAGLADRYKDIALMIRSLKHNEYGKDEIDYFLDQYGIKDLDENKVKLYTLLDEFS